MFLSVTCILPKDFNLALTLVISGMVTRLYVLPKKSNSIITASSEKSNAGQILYHYKKKKKISMQQLFSEPLYMCKGGSSEQNIKTKTKFCLFKTSGM